MGAAAELAIDIGCWYLPPAYHAAAGSAGLTSSVTGVPGAGRSLANILSYGNFAATVSCMLGAGAVSVCPRATAGTVPTS